MKEIVILLLLFLVIGMCAVGYDYTVCNSKTRDIGFEHRFSVFGGCQIEINPNQWIPLESYYFKQE